MSCVEGDFCSHGSSNSFSIGKYPFFIHKIELKNFARNKQKSLEKSRLFRAISFLSPFDGWGGAICKERSDGIANDDIFYIGRASLYFNDTISL